ncbi:4'-phosphopantetheinyl transferase superfamily protein [Fibrella sp. HMF5335]|uniref:4'-phosphopantetheinyl transferase superfamily protein n=1 Tax=Fibrella rubiginis TaxID=2817060 RepID=A0A939JZZ5_9BACT|nr:4'-phosphopantetheinyl transferase superfamily protein [Fibrella rubiginis]MBO0935557.1 4'-phosphopantetheinyl transferase superfamily protein [Fibrella rubiginis]
MATVSCLTLPLVSWLPWSANARDNAPDTSVLVFRCAVNSPMATSTPLHLLTTAEWQRASRFHQSIDRQRFVLGRSLLRQVTAHFSGQSPEQIELLVGPRGKPEWVNSAGWQVNLAHAGAWVLLALAKQAVGIDVEEIQSGFDYYSLTNSVLSNIEQDYTAQQVNSQHAFYDLWTRKEALVKATGLGLSEHLPHVPVLAGTHIVADDKIGGAGLFTIANFWVDNQHPAAVAWAGALSTTHSPVTCYTV